MTTQLPWDRFVPQEEQVELPYVPPVNVPVPYEPEVKPAVPTQQIPIEDLVGAAKTLELLLKQVVASNKKYSGWRKYSKAIATAVGTVLMFLAVVVTEYTNLFSPDQLSSIAAIIMAGTIVITFFVRNLNSDGSPAGEGKPSPAQTGGK